MVHGTNTQSKSKQLFFKDYHRWGEHPSRAQTHCTNTQRVVQLRSEPKHTPVTVYFFLQCYYFYFSKKNRNITTYDQSRDSYRSETLLLKIPLMSDTSSLSYKEWTRVPLFRHSSVTNHQFSIFHFFATSFQYIINRSQITRTEKSPVKSFNKDMVQWVS